MENNSILDLDDKNLQNEIDNKYIQEIKNGNIDALNKIMERYKSYVYFGERSHLLCLHSLPHIAINVNGGGVL